VNQQPQFQIGPGGQLLGPQGQSLGYTVLQTPAGLVAVPNQLGAPPAPAPAPAHPGTAPAPAPGASSGIPKLLIAAAVLGVGYWAWKKFVSPRTESGREELVREHRSRRSSSRLLSEVKRFLQENPSIGRELRERAEENAEENAEEGAEEDFCGECEAGECREHG
jgi:hypothetical protein